MFMFLWRNWTTTRLINNVLGLIVELKFNKTETIKQFFQSHDFNISLSASFSTQTVFVALEG